MKLFSACIFLMLISCAHIKPTPAKQAATFDDCTAVYAHIITIQANNLYADKSINDKELLEAIILLDENYRKTGKEERFFGFCSNRMTRDEADCMLSVDNMDIAKLCVGK